MAKNGGYGLVYRGDEESWSVYEMYLDDRVIFEASVNNEDPELVIHVGRRGATFGQVWSIDKSISNFGDLVPTKGRAKRVTHVVGGSEDQAPDGVHDHIDGFTLQTYVYPRALFLMAAIFVPVTSQVIADDDDDDDDDDEVDLAREIATRLRAKGLHQGERINFLETEDQDERIAGILRDWIEDEETEDNTRSRLESFGGLDMSEVNLDYLTSLFMKE